jgi:hypothetical protein
VRRAVVVALAATQVKRGAPLKRRSPLKAKKGLKRTALKAGSRRRSTPKRWLNAKAKRCALCGRRKGLTQHHVVYEQHVRKHGGDPFDPRDGLTVCLDEHNRHHDGSAWKIPVARLRPDNLQFALELLGDYAADYLARHYDGTPAEIQARLLTVAV